ncbi:putative phage tail assembly chaperone [Vibrio sp. 10N.261.51.F12]|uniref:putative phage tail assembly chaperone n=1 Tax=Vibrio sp. 10N.261.51.F12 TaxID=3229679 RepID=UPI00354EDF8D
MSKSIVLTVGNTDIEFIPTPAEYDEAQNTILQGDASSAAHNFLMSCVSEDSKEALREITNNNAGAATQIYGAVLKEYAPKLAISVKK